MTSILRVIEGRARDLGGFGVRRVLPAAGMQTVGPFIFFDHMGPAVFTAGHGVEVRPHPHIGIATVTYLYEGAFMHRDSLGSARAHGIQTWVALPAAQEEVEPSFAHHPAGTLPEIRRPGAVLRVIAGEAWGARAPARVYSICRDRPASDLVELRVEFARAYRPRQGRLAGRALRTGARRRLAHTAARRLTAARRTVRVCCRSRDIRGRRWSP